jgi:hypothetical protein
MKVIVICILSLQFIAAALCHAQITNEADAKIAAGTVRHTEVSIRGEDFYINGQPTYPGRSWNGRRIEGLLFNVRLVQGIFDDLNPETTNRWAYPDTGRWDADRNTDEFLAAMPEWRKRGLLAFTLNLQGGSPYGYSRDQPWRNSAFNPDGSLRADYLPRLEKILDRADEIGMVVILGFFYQAQDRVLTNETAVLRAVDDTTGWVLEHGYRNVIIEINNECDQHYANEILRPERVHELVSRVRGIERNGRHLLASTSYSGPLPKANVATNADFILIHGNGVKQPRRITESVSKIRQMLGDAPKPIVFNEDDNYNFDKPTNNFIAAVSEHASWGYFDYRRKGENFNEGFQSVPADWTIGSARKRAFFQLLCEITGSPAAVHALKVSSNHRFLVDADNDRPVFILADTAWNLGALKLEEVETYLQSREDHGFNTIMFALNFAPQADETNAYGQPAYIGADKTELNPAYFETCDAIIKKAAAHHLYVMLYAMWAGEKSGAMNRYTAGQLATLGHALGRHYAGVPNVIFCAGGESTPNYIEVDRVNALGSALKEGCEGNNLVTVHPTSPNSSSKFYATSSWLDFYMSQAKSGSAPAPATFDAAALVLGDWKIPSVKPTMMAEHRYESGTQEDPLIQRRSLYQCAFAGGCGYAYGHNALWQMTPHTGLPWMLRGWAPGVTNWTQALDTAAVGQLHFIKTLLYSHPYLERIPDQSLVLAGQGTNVATRVQATRDGSLGHNDATYMMAYISSPQTVTLDTSVISARTLNVFWFNPETGVTTPTRQNFPNQGSFTLEQRAQAADGVIVIDDAGKNYPLAGKLPGPTNKSSKPAMLP